MNPNEDITKLITGVSQICNPRKLQRYEIEKAKRVMGFKMLLRSLGDETLLSHGKSNPTHSPFHPPTGEPKFYFYKRNGRWAFSCCEKCGKVGYQIDYLT